MRPIEAYGDLLAMERPVISTAEAAARWRVGVPSASRRLAAIERAGLARRVRRGLWTLDVGIDPATLGPYLTAPHPSYVSLHSALVRHGMIEQIPRSIALASLERSRVIDTSLGRFEVHHLTPTLFGGFSGDASSGYVASPEKAIFDAVYLRAAAGSRAYFPELTLPAGFERKRLERWSEAIESKRLRTLVKRRLGEVLAVGQEQDQVEARNLDAGAGE